MKKILYSCVLCFALSACGTKTETLPAQQLVYGADVSDAFYTDRLQLIDSAMQSYIDKEYLPQCVTMVVHRGRVVHNKAFGWRDKETQIPCTVNDIFRLASQTKAISVVALMTLFEEGKFQLDEPIKNYIPEFANPQVLVDYKLVNGEVINVKTRPAKRDITIRHLITHTSGICYDGVFDKLLKMYGVAGHNTLDTLTLQENVKRMAAVPLKHDPGEAFTYAYNTDVLGRLAEILSNKDFATFITERVLEPCDMHNTFFHVPADKQSKVVTLYSYINQQLLPSDNLLFQTFPYAGARTFYSPSAGLCGTIDDYAKFCQMILNGGTFNNNRVIGRKTLEMMQKNGVADMRGEIGFGMAWDVFTPQNAHNTIISEGSMRWGGMFGTDYVIDPQEQLIIILYTNCMPNFSKHDAKTLLHNVTYQALK